MKKYIFSIVALVLIMQLSTGVAQAGKSTSGGSSGGSSLTGTTFQDSFSYRDGDHTIEERIWVDNGGVGHQADTCTDCGHSSGGGGGDTNPCQTFFSGKNATGGCTPPPAPPSPPAVCTITADKHVIGLGTSVIHLSWKPIPATNVSLQRQAVGMKLAEGMSQGRSQQASIILAGGGGTTVSQPVTTQMVGRVLIAPPSSAESFDDTVNVALQGAGTNMTTVISRRGDIPNQQASIILAGGGGTTVVPAPVIATAINKDGGTITYNLSFTSTPTQNPTPTAGGNPMGGSGGHVWTQTVTVPGAVILAGGGGTTVSASPVTYTCSVTVKIVAKITECNDGIDNADPEDALIDQQDPGCHTDGNPANALSYDPTIVSETNTPIDLIAHITAPQKSNAQQPLQIVGSEENLSSLFVTANTLVTGWRNTAAVGTPSCGLLGNLCFTANGHSYIRTSSFVQSFLPHILQLDTPQSFTPQTPGTYEVCAVADYYNVIQEGATGEANNVACQTVQVLAVATTDTSVPPTITGVATLSASPTRVKRGSTATLVWNTGGRTKCTIQGANGQVISLVGAPSAATGVTSPITAETKYTLSCLDDNSSADATVKILPQYQEI